MPDRYLGEKYTENTLDLLRSIIRVATATLSQYENMDNNGGNKLQLYQIFRKLSKKATDDEPDELKLLRSLKAYFERKFPELFTGYLGSVVVFFMPGTNDPSPLYFGDYWNEPFKAGSPIKSRKKMDGRIEMISAKLRQYNAPKPEDDKYEYDPGHFFFCSSLHVKIISSLICDDPDNAIITGDLDSCGYSGLTSWAIPKENVELVIPTKNEDHPEFKIKWASDNPDRAYLPPMITSPVYVGEDSLVLMATFLDQQTFSDCKANQISFDRLLFCHNLCASDVLGKFYGSILRSGMAILRDNLQRTHISGRLFREISKNLRADDEDEGKFNYLWTKDGSKGRCLADLESSFSGDLLSDPGNVFEHVIKVEDRIYKQLVKEWCELGYGDSNLPKSMPLSDILKSLEQAQRALNTKGRDHILHQFQVFLLGCLIIRKYEDKFINCFSKSFEEIGGEYKDIEKDSAECSYLLKMAWFLCSTLHDVGYPVQDVDDVVEKLRFRVAKLLTLEEQYVEPINNFHVDEILYDDPRTYIILKDIARNFAEWQGGDKETWWYFFRHLAFNEKHHAIVSTISLCMCLLDYGKHDNIRAIKEFIKKPFWKYLTKHVLLPIILHHVYSWVEFDAAITKSYKVMKCGQKKKNRITGVFEELRTFYDHEQIENPTIKFEENPLAILLALCDIMQETGRPSGAREAYWPNSAADEVYFNGMHGYGDFVYDLTLQYGPNVKSKCITDKSDRFKKLDHLWKICDMSLQGFCFKILAQHKGKKGPPKEIGKNKWDGH